MVNDNKNIIEQSLHLFPKHNDNVVLPRVIASNLSNHEILVESKLINLQLTVEWIQRFMFYNQCKWNVLIGNVFQKTIKCTPYSTCL